MHDGDPHDEIARLEARIAELSAALEICRKVAQAAKLAILIGGLWMAAALIGLVRTDGLAIVGATALIIGGIVVFGSNAGTARQARADLSKAEALRAGLIDGIALRVVTAPEQD